MRQSVPIRVYWFLALGVFAVGWSAILIRLAEAPPLGIAAHRMLEALCSPSFFGKEDSARVARPVGDRARALARRRRVPRGPFRSLDRIAPPYLGGELGGAGHYESDFRRGGRLPDSRGSGRGRRCGQGWASPSREASCSPCPIFTAGPAVDGEISSRFPERPCVRLPALRKKFKRQIASPALRYGLLRIEWRSSGGLRSCHGPAPGAVSPANVAVARRDGGRPNPHRSHFLQLRHPAPHAGEGEPCDCGRADLGCDSGRLAPLRATHAAPGV